MSMSLAVHPCVVTVTPRKKVWVKDTRSNDAIIVRDITAKRIFILSNQRLTGVVAIACHDMELTILDSALISSRSLRLVDCENVSVICEDVDVRRIELFRCRGCSVTVVGDDVLLHVMHCFTREGCSGNKFCIAEYLPSQFLPPKIDRVLEAAIPDSADGKQYFTRVPYPGRIESRLLVSNNELTEEGLALQEKLLPVTLPTMFGARDADILFAPRRIPTGAELLEALAELEARPYAVTDEEVAAQYDREREEFVGPPDELADKARAVAELLRTSGYCVVYTGAGISTSASIPDFRGPNGAWTNRDKGLVAPQDARFSDANPTFAHYAITELVKRGMVKYVVTTNCDGLHWRTGMPVTLLEELHGSEFSLYCPRCMTWTRTLGSEVDYDDHVTDEVCKWCGAELLSTGVAFCESYRSPQEPIVTRFHAESADLALVLGTSMTVQSAAMYPMQVIGKGKMVLVNIQHTPVDEFSDVRVYARTDDFFRLLVEELGIRDFDTETDVLRQMEREARQAAAEE
jgi:NAD-dependent SIR2 family protein deacetylase